MKARGKFVGISLRIDEGVERIDPYWKDLDIVTILGTEVGIKGASMDANTPEKVRHARRSIDRLGLSAEVEVDGGIRRQSVPLIHAAGADWIVPGSLMFGEDPGEMRRWLASFEAGEADLPRSHDRRLCIKSAPSIIAWRWFSRL